VIKLPTVADGVSWSPDGKSIAYKSDCFAGLDNYWCNPLVIAVDGGRPHTLVSNRRPHPHGSRFFEMQSFSDSPIVWLPDSNIVATDDDRNNGVVLANSQTGALRFLPRSSQSWPGGELGYSLAVGRSSGKLGLITQVGLDGPASLVLVDPASGKHTRLSVRAVDGAQIRRYSLDVWLR
jgi:hypothetical protein